MPNILFDQDNLANEIVELGSSSIKLISATFEEGSNLYGSIVMVFEDNNIVKARINFTLLNRYPNDNNSFIIEKPIELFNSKINCRILPNDTLKNTFKFTLNY